MAAQNLGIGQIRILSCGIKGILAANDLDIRQILVFLIFGPDGVLGTGNHDIRYIARIACCTCIRIPSNHILIARYKDIFKGFRVGRIIGKGFHFQYIFIPDNTIAVPFHSVFIPKDPRIRSTYISSCTCCSRTVLAAQNICICSSDPVFGTDCPRRNTFCLCICPHCESIFCQCLSRITHSGSTFAVALGIAADGDGFVIRNASRIANGNSFIYAASAIFYRGGCQSPYSQRIISGSLSASPDCRVILITADG